MTRRVAADRALAPPVRLALSIGCPCGIGPEVAALAAIDASRDHGSDVRVALVGDHAALVLAARGRDLDERRFVRVPKVGDAWELSHGAIGVFQPTADLAARDRKPGEPTRASGAAQLAWIDAACDLASSGGADAMVTGPVSKDAIVRSRAPGSARFLGHTEHLQRRLRAREVVMAFSSPELTTALVTTHLALADVPRAITPVAVARATYWLSSLLATLAPHGVTPRVVVCGLNPHAGERGLLGAEERTRITPGIARAKKRLAADGVRVDLSGPVPAESAFRLAVAKRYDGVVAMYHDQATIPMKLVGFGDAVNVSLGLPIVRTSVDHGTAYDRAGKGTADPRGMREAIALALSLVTAARAARAPSRSRAQPTRTARRA